MASLMASRCRRRSARWNGDYVCRTASNITIYAHDRVFTVGDLPITRGESVAIADVEMTLARYGPVLVIGVWDDDQDAPIYLISSLTDADAAVAHYRMRFRIERLFANHKSRGFHIPEKSPERSGASGAVTDCHKFGLCVGAYAGRVCSRTELGSPVSSQRPL
jgi:hypothetical protein